MAKARVTLRLEKELYDKLKEIADKDRRSISSMIAIILEDCMGMGPKK